VELDGSNEVVDEETDDVGVCDSCDIPNIPFVRVGGDTPTKGL
jgi:hypothetical protein